MFTYTKCENLENQNYANVVLHYLKQISGESSVHL